jgi:flagellar biosynthetic protein FliR
VIEFTSAQINAWLSVFLWPLARILAVIAVAPFFSNQSTPGTVKIGLGAALTLMIAPVLPAMPDIQVSSTAGLFILAQQVLIGTGIGFVFRLVIAVIEMTGEAISMTSGLGFAAFYDPQSQSQSGVIRQFLVILTTTLFISLDGHLLLISTLVESFNSLPITATPVSTGFTRQIVHWGGNIFKTGVHLALPIIAAMLIANMALGILTRAAPQLNLFAIGFPFTLGIAFVVLLFVVPLLATPLDNLFNEGFLELRKILKP